MNIGFSTGALHKHLPLTSCLPLYKSLGCCAVELNYVRLHDLLAADFEAEALRKLLDGFDWVSLHAPVKVNYGAPKNSYDREIFAKIQKLHEMRLLDLVVFHPETVADFAPFKDLNFPVAFENMDNRKGSCRSAEDIVKILSISESFWFVLDVNHVCTNDPTMNLADEFYNQAGHRLKEIHLSGYAGYHEPLHVTRQSGIVGAIKRFDVPIIIESVVSPETLDREMDYIIQTIEWLRK